MERELGSENSMRPGNKKRYKTVYYGFFCDYARLESKYNILSSCGFGADAG